MEPDPKYDGHSWIRVPRYEMDPEKSWEERYRELETHHVAETSFLIEEVRRLAALIKQSPTS
jgi:hypothetical protein